MEFFFYLEIEVLAKGVSLEKLDWIFLFVSMLCFSKKCTTQNNKRFAIVKSLKKCWTFITVYFLTLLFTFFINKIDFMKLQGKAQFHETNFTSWFQKCDYYTRKLWKVNLNFFERDFIDESSISLDKNYLFSIFSMGLLSETLWLTREMAVLKYLLEIWDSKYIQSIFYFHVTFFY